MPQVRDIVFVPADGRPAGGDRAALASRSWRASATRRCSARPAPARRRRWRGSSSRSRSRRSIIAHNKTLAAQLCNEFREFFPIERGRVLRLVLRLLPARGVRPAGRSLHREGLLAERRHRAAAARCDVVALHAPRRDRRRVGLVHLRARLAGGVARADDLARAGRGARPRPVPAQADRLAVRAQRHGPRPRALPREGRRRRDPAGEPGDRVPHLVLRRRGRADHALRSAERRGLREARQPRDLAGDGVRHVAADDRARRRRDPPRARGAAQGARG